MLTLQKSWWQKYCISIGLLTGCGSSAWHCMQTFVLLFSWQPLMLWPKCGSPFQNHSLAFPWSVVSLIQNQDIRVLLLCGWRGHGILSGLMAYWVLSFITIHLLTLQFFFTDLEGCMQNQAKLFVLYSHTYEVVLFWCSRYIYFFVSGVFFVCPDLLFCQKFCFIWRSGDLYSYCFTSFSHLNLISIFCTVAHSEKSEQSNSHEFTDISELSPPELCSLQSGFLPLASFFFNSCRSACFLFF